MSNSRVLNRSLAVVLLCGSLAACSLFDRTPPYSDSRGSSRLEVPDGLDRPSTDPALAVPPISASAGGLLGRDAQRPPDLGIGSPSAAASFAVEGAASAVYQQVGQALADNSNFPIVASDEQNTRYRIEVTAAPASKQRWWAFWRRERGGRAEVLVQVTAAGSGATVSVLGPPASSEQAGALLALLRERLSG